MVFNLANSLELCVIRLPFTIFYKQSAINYSFSLGVAETEHNHELNKIAMKFSPNELNFLNY